MKLAFLGAGNMAGAMLDRWLAAGLDPALVAIVDPFATPRAGIVQHASLDEWQAAGNSIKAAFGAAITPAVRMAK